MEVYSNLNKKILESQDGLFSDENEFPLKEEALGINF